MDDFSFFCLYRSATFEDIALVPDVPDLFDLPPPL